MSLLLNTLPGTPFCASNIHKNPTVYLFYGPCDRQNQFYSIGPRYSKRFLIRGLTTSDGTLLMLKLMAMSIFWTDKLWTVPRNLSHIKLFDLTDGPTF